jgi:hypothetical protein
MSSFNTSKFNSKKVAPIGSRKPFCKVCKDAGKSEAEYTSHYVRENPDPSSKVVCPTLLALQCTYCDGAGHTVSYCKVLEKRKKDEAKIQRMEKMAEEKGKTKVVPTSAKKSSNAFAALCSDSDSETEPRVINPHKTMIKKFIEKTKQEQEKEQEQETKMPGKVTESDFPQLNPSAMNTKKKEVKSFSGIAIKVREEEEQRKLEQEEAELTARLEEIKKKKQPTTTVFKTPVCLPSRTQVAIAPTKAPLAVACATIPMPPVFERQTTSIFAKPAYLEDMESDSEEEEEVYKPRTLVFDRAEIDDEDW